MGKGSDPQHRTETHNCFGLLPQNLSSTRNRELFKYSNSPLPSKQSPQVTNIQIPIVGLVGGIGSGKSTVIRHVQGLHFEIINADDIAHELLETDRVRSAVLERFGESILDESGTVNRKSLGRLVFGETEEHRMNRQDLEKILHPEIRSRVEEMIRQVRPSSDSGGTTRKDGTAGTDVIILDAALLLEAGWDSVCDAVIFIDTPVEVRQERVQRNRGWSADELPKREALQMSIAEKRARSQYIVDNSGSLKESAASMERILNLICSKKKTTLRQPSSET